MRHELTLNGSYASKRILSSALRQLFSFRLILVYKQAFLQTISAAPFLPWFLWITLLIWLREPTEHAWLNIMLSVLWLSRNITSKLALATTTGIYKDHVSCRLRKLALVSDHVPFCSNSARRKKSIIIDICVLLHKKNLLLKKCNILNSLRIGMVWSYFFEHPNCPL